MAEQAPASVARGFLFEVRVIQMIACASLVDHPARPAGEAMINMRTREKWTREKAGQDVQVRVTLHEGSGKICPMCEVAHAQAVLTQLILGHVPV